tara:strand:+ start:572 stop:871 length:300 start_codon:yes stop_codon:yes gene_type:complete
MKLNNKDDVKLLSGLYERNYLCEDETLVLAEGFDDAIVGITTQFPKKIIYNYWECINILLKIGDEDNQLDFDESLIYLDEYIKEISTVKDFAPIFMKTI